MADVRIEIVGRSYMLACRDGEEEHLQSLGKLVDAKARDAARAMGSLTENRQLLVAALLLADQINEGGKPAMSPSPAPAADETALVSAAETIERLAQRLENLAASLEAEAPNA